MLKFYTAALAALAAFVGAASAQFSVSPLNLELEPAGGTATLIVTNTKPTQLALEVGAERREVGPDGEAITTEASEEFAIFPPLALVQPGASQTVRIQYVGDRDGPDVGYYSLVVRDTNATRPEDASGSGVAVQFTYTLGMSVSMADTAPAVSVTSATSTPDGLVIEVANDGNRHAVLTRAKMQAIYDGEAVPVTEYGFLGFSLLNAGERRTFTVPTSVFGERGQPDGYAFVY